jgi:glycosyltransferase involved in cell wall biosynthesis
VSQSAPKVSVCIPSYNGVPYLSETIDSVLSQLYEDFELVVSDDASDDDTPEVCERYNDSRLRYERSGVRVGLAGNWNRCIALARGEYVTLLCQDDLLLPGYLRRAVAILDDHPDVGLLHCAVQLFDEAGIPLNLAPAYEDEKCVVQCEADRVDRDELELRQLLVFGNVIYAPGVMVRHCVYETVGRFCERLDWCPDWHMWIRIALRWPIAYLAQPLALFRWHPHSATAACLASGRHVCDEHWAVEDVFQLIRETRPDLSHLKAAAMHANVDRACSVAEMLWQRGDMTAARAGLQNAVRIYPEMRRQPRVRELLQASDTRSR